MEKRIVTISPADVPIDDVLTKLNMKKEHKLYNRIHAMFLESAQIAKPIALYAAIAPKVSNGKIVLNGVVLEETFVHEMLSGCDVVIPYVSSCGIEIDEWSNSFDNNMFDQFVADALKETYLDAVQDKLISEVQEHFFSSGKSISTINPGSLSKWPIAGQKPLFEILGSITNDIGVLLKDSMMMVPTKSVSGIAFERETAYHNCQLCSRVDCPSRVAPYEGE